VVLKHSKHQNYLEGFKEHRWLGPIPTVSESVGLRWNLRILISNRFPRDVDAAGPEDTI